MKNENRFPVIIGRWRLTMDKRNATEFDNEYWAGVRRRWMTRTGPEHDDEPIVIAVETTSNGTWVIRCQTSKNWGYV